MRGEMFTIKVDGAVLVDVDLVYHVLQLGVARAQAQLSHDLAELGGSDITCSNC